MYPSIHFNPYTASLSDSTGAIFSAAEAGISIKLLSKAALASSINTAQGIYNSAEEGILQGTYPAGTKDRLNNAITTAIDVRDNGTATEEQILQAIVDLNAAVAQFQGLIITAATGDFNIGTYPGIDIGDLGVIADCYGKTSTDTGWNDIKHMDINGDGESGRQTGV